MKTPPVFCNIFFLDTFSGNTLFRIIEKEITGIFTLQTPLSLFSFPAFLAFSGRQGEYFPYQFRHFIELIPNRQKSRWVSLSTLFFYTSWKTDKNKNNSLIPRILLSFSVTRERKKQSWAARPRFWPLLTFFLTIVIVANQWTGEHQLLYDLNLISKILDKYFL